MRTCPLAREPAGTTWLAQAKLQSLISRNRSAACKRSAGNSPWPTPNLWAALGIASDAASLLGQSCVGDTTTKETLWRITTCHGLSLNPSPVYFTAIGVAIGIEIKKCLQHKTELKSKSYVLSTMSPLCFTGSSFKAIWWYLQIKASSLPFHVIINWPFSLDNQPDLFNLHWKCSCKVLKKSFQQWFISICAFLQSLLFCREVSQGHSLPRHATAQCIPWRTKHGCC